jgi:hypothetical protein
MLTCQALIEFCLIDIGLHIVAGDLHCPLRSLYVVDTIELVGVLRESDHFVQVRVHGELVVTKEDPELMIKSNGVYLDPSQKLVVKEFL